MSQQLAFDLPVQVAFRRADFFASAANAEALAAIDIAEITGPATDGDEP